MFKTLIKTITKYFSLGASEKPLLLNLFVSAAFRSVSQLALPFAASQIIEYVTDGDFKTAIVWSVVSLGAGLAYTALHHWNYVAYRDHAVSAHNTLQRLILTKVASYDENFSKEISTPFILNAAFNDVGNIYQIPDQLFDAVSNTLNIVIAIIILLVANPLIGTFSLLFSLISFYSVIRNLDKRNFYIAGQRYHQDNISGLMGQVIDGNKEIKSFNIGDELENYLDDYKKEWSFDYKKKRYYGDNAEVLTPMILSFGKILIYFIAIHLVLQGQYSVAALVLVIGYYENIEDCFYSFYKCIDSIFSNTTRVDRVHRVLNYNTKNMLEFGKNNDDTIGGKIEFKNVCFTYEKNEILKNVSFKIEPDTFTVIAGKSGSGKSTIFRLLLRLYKLDYGEILLDDTNIFDYSAEVYPNNVSIVTQKPFLFDMSIRENLNLVDSNHAHQIAACKTVGIHDYIMSLPDGYNTKLLRDADNLSAGHKQLLSLARTLLSRSEVLLFDEITSTLDLNTSKQIVSILKKLKKDHTILMITHKPELMKLADDIIVIDHGRLVGRGTHKELARKNKYYKLLQK